MLSNGISCVRNAERHLFWSRTWNCTVISIVAIDHFHVRLKAAQKGSETSRKSTNICECIQERSHLAVQLKIVIVDFHIKSISSDTNSGGNSSQIYFYKFTSIHKFTSFLSARMEYTQINIPAKFVQKFSRKICYSKDIWKNMKCKCKRSRLEKSFQCCGLLPTYKIIKNTQFQRIFKNFNSIFQLFSFFICFDLTNSRFLFWFHNHNIHNKKNIITNFKIRINFFKRKRKFTNTLDTRILWWWPVDNFFYCQSYIWQLNLFQM